MKTKSLTVLGNEISRFIHDKDDFICLTDMAKGQEADPGEYIRNWLRTGSTIEFLGVWEKVNNPNFNLVEFHQIRADFIKNTFIMSVKKWIELTSAAGIVARPGRYGGTYAHKDIAIHFANWLNPEFYVYFVREFQRIKKEEDERLGTGWDLRRELAKVNWRIHTEAVREHLVPLIDWHGRKEAIYQASEADLLNLALFGFTAKEWKLANPDKKGNIREYASVEHLLVLSNLQAINAKLIEWESPKEQRFDILNKTARDQMDILINTKAIENIKRLQ